jgi:predicted nucleic acid-binding protein
MIVVADAGPLHYLVVIGAVDVLGPLYNRVVLPEAVWGRGADRVDHQERAGAAAAHSILLSIHL